MIRVTNNITTNRFLTNNNRALTQMLQSENRIHTQRRFNRVSEDTINGSKAMTLRRQLRNIDIYNDNLSAAKALISAAEVNLTSIADKEYIRVEERLTQAVNGTYSQEELDEIATELDEIADQMVKELNGDFSERQIFGGASNGKTPFQAERVMIKDNNGTVVFPPDYGKYYNDDGSLKEGVSIDDIPKTVTYNGVPLDFDVTGDMILGDGKVVRAKAGENTSYTISYFDGNKGEWNKETQDIPAESVDAAINGQDNSLMYPGSKPVYVDIGLGIKYNDKYEVDPQTALDLSMNGAKITGNGIDISRTGVNGRVSSANDMSGGFAAATFATMTLSVNGKEYDLELDMGTALPVSGAPYDDETIEAALNSALKNAYKAKSGKTLPKDVTMGYSGGNVSIGSGASEISIGTNSLGFAEGTVERTVPMNEDGTPDISERYSKNLMQLVMDAAAALRRGDQDTVNAIIDRANEANNHILTEITTLGTKQNSIEFYQEKNEDYEFSLKERQNIVEGTDMESEIIRYEAIKAAYDATLKMGSQILPHSIFDFI